MYFYFMSQTMFVDLFVKNIFINNVCLKTYL